MMLPRNRAYINWAVPVDEHGNDIGVCMDSETYHRYLEWLADYLFETEIPIPVNQQGLLDEYRVSGVDHAIIDLSDCLGYSVYETESIEEESISYEERHQAELDLWHEMTDAEREDWDKDDFFTSQEECLRLRKEYLDSQCVPSNISHADIPYRPVLAALLKAVPAHDMRYALLDRFYCNFNDCVSK